jgi:fatty acid desaturase
MLRHRADARTVGYMAAATLIAVVHWTAPTFHPVLLAAAVVMAFAIAAMNHNHSHFPMWRGASLNRLTDYWFTIFNGHPGFAFQPMHVAGHHRFHNTRPDPTRTDRFRAGNDLVGLLRHPFEFAWVAVPLVARHAGELRRRDPRGFWWAVSHYAVLATVDGAALAWDPARALYCVVLPQAAALFFLLVSNYLQHAAAVADSEYDHARNFTGLINPLFFNVGYHTAHHHFPDAHWSELPAAHARIASRISPALLERSFVAYCTRVFVLGKP